MDTHALLGGNSHPCVGRGTCRSTLTFGPGIIIVGLKAGSDGSFG